MKRDLPTPSEILEELASKAAIQIDMHAPVAFESALDEFVRYHRFLLAMSATRTPDGNAFSLAEVRGGLWNAPHQEWVKQYRRLFERAADCVSDDPIFLSTLAYVPIRLLPREGDQELSHEVLNSIVDLGTMLVDRLEGWVAKRTVSEHKDGYAVPRITLAGSDSKTYGDVLCDVVAAWERLPQSYSEYSWNSNSLADDTVRWDAHRGRWPFLWRHLTNTAYMLAVAVWNEDQQGVDAYRDALVRWPITLGLQYAEAADLLDRRLLFPIAMNLDWGAVMRRYQPIMPAYADAPDPDQLFSAILRGAHQDVTLLTGALLLYWALNEKQLSDLGARTACALFQQARPEDESGASRWPSERSFAPIFLDVLRLEIAGARFESSSYGAALDQFIAGLDNMTERRVIPGRVFTPSTLHDRELLLLPMIALLLSVVPPDGDDGVRARIEELVTADSVLPDGDRSLRKLIQELGRFSTALENSLPEIQRVIGSLESRVDFDEAVKALACIVTDTKSTIENELANRIKAMPVSDAKLELIRNTVQDAVANPGYSIPFFSRFRIEFLPHEETGVEPLSILIQNILKVQLVEREMDGGISDLPDMCASVVRDAVANGIWRLLAQRRREHVLTGGRIDNAQFWGEVTKLAEKVGAEPILVVSLQAEGRAMRRFLYSLGGEKTGLNIERKPQDCVREGYIVTIEGVDIYGAASFKPRTAWLFSAQALCSLRYRYIDDSGHLVTIAFEPQDALKGVLRVQFQQSAVWSESPIFELELGSAE